MYPEIPVVINTRLQFRSFILHQGGRYLLDEVLDRLEKVSVTDDWSDEEIIERYDNAAPHPDCPDIFGYPGSVRILSDDTVCKASGSASLILAEVNALEFVRAHTSIPVPQVRRVLTGPTRSRFLMEYIKGRPLARLWLCMTLWQRFIVAWTLRSYIRQLRVASAAYERRTVPGPMGDSPQGFFTPLWMFGDRFKGPYNTWAEFCDELNRRYGKRGLGLFNPTEDLVLTHGDLTARNIVVGEDGRLWLVDWGMSGFYPPWFEYIATMSAAFRDAAPKSWFKHTPLFTGYYPVEQKILGWGNPRDIVERGRTYELAEPPAFRPL